jgi:4a-hydroxytetrahydrobiopterin dehydratase
MFLSQQIGSIKKSRCDSKTMKTPEGWRIKKGRLCREFEFKDFKETLKFVNEVGKIAERQGHHPEIWLTWGRCIIEIYTHSAKKITGKDFCLASEINKIR